ADGVGEEAPSGAVRRGDAADCAVPDRRGLRRDARLPARAGDEPRTGRMSREIDLSVVVAASWSAEAARRTVASIGGGDGVEVIVASAPDRVAPAGLPG